jgi:hypothetical protein
MSYQSPLPLRELQTPLNFTRPFCMNMEKSYMKRHLARKLKLKRNKRDMSAHQKGTAAVWLSQLNLFFISLILHLAARVKSAI